MFRHPLYIGNFLLVGGTVFLFNPDRRLAAFLIAMFLLEYGLFIYGEERYLKDLVKHKEKFAWRRLKNEFSTWLVVSVVWMVYFLKL